MLTSGVSPETTRPIHFKRSCLTIKPTPRERQSRKMGRTRAPSNVLSCRVHRSQGPSLRELLVVQDNKFPPACTSELGFSLLAQRALSRMQLLSNPTSHKKLLVTYYCEPFQTIYEHTYYFQLINAPCTALHISTSRSTSAFLLAA